MSGRLFSRSFRSIIRQVQARRTEARACFPNQRVSRAPWHVGEERSRLQVLPDNSGFNLILTRTSVVQNEISPEVEETTSCAGADFHPGAPILSTPGETGNPSVVRTQGDAGQVTVHFETGQLAWLASGAVVASIGDTKVLATAVAGHTLDPKKTFLPLQVDYREKQHAVGRIPNSFMRREGAPKEREILCSRVIDRSLRPLFPKGFFYDTQITANVLCSDQEHDPDVLAINAASAALSMSDIPWAGPVGAVRVGRINGELIVNPTMNQLVESDLNLVYACTADKTLMIEAQAREVTNEDLEKALRLAHDEAVCLIPPQLELAAAVNPTKRTVATANASPEVMDMIRRRAAADVAAVLLARPPLAKQARGEQLSALESRLSASLIEEGETEAAAMLGRALESIKREVIRDAVFDSGNRVDGRVLTSVRQVSCDAGILTPLHGSALFSRGSTQVLCTVTLGPPEDAQRLDSVVGPTQKRFMVHYSFPSFSINEVRQERGGLNRREVGHGTLAEKALLAVLPPEDGFPFSVRITSEVMASDGSTSMATVCGGSLALMDAGIAVREHVAGVSIGLVTRNKAEGEAGDGQGAVPEYQLLTDILGLEDYLGDMDFKIAGTRKGITAIQLDIKLPGLPLPIICDSLAPALAARSKILDAMDVVLPAPRLTHKPSAPHAGTVQINRENIGRLIGPQGSVVKSMQQQTGSRISVTDDGLVSIFARDKASFDETAALITATIGQDLLVGETYEGTVSIIRDFGAILSFDGGRDGLLHISEIDHLRVDRVSDVLTIGEKVSVQCVGRDMRGNVKLSRKVLLPIPPGLPPPPVGNGRGGSGRGGMGRGGRGGDGNGGYSGNGMRRGNVSETGGGAVVDGRNSGGGGFMSGRGRGEGGREADPSMPPWRNQDAADAPARYSDSTPTRDAVAPRMDSLRGLRSLETAEQEIPMQRPRGRPRRAEPAASDAAENDGNGNSRQSVTRRHQAGGTQLCDPAETAPGWEGAGPGVVPPSLGTGAGTRRIPPAGRHSMGLEIESEVIVAQTNSISPWQEDSVFVPAAATSPRRGSAAGRTERVEDVDGWEVGGELSYSDSDPEDVDSVRRRSEEAEGSEVQEGDRVDVLVKEVRPFGVLVTMKSGVEAVLQFEEMELQKMRKLRPGDRLEAECSESREGFRPKFVAVKAIAA